MEVNSCFSHVLPSLCLFKKDILIVIGGKSSKKCEYYSITNKKWKSLPELPEYRFGCSAYSDNATNIVYLFGGYDQENQKCCGSILKLNMNVCVKWDTLIVLENSLCLEKYHSVLAKVKDTHVWLLGGKTKYSEEEDDSIKELDRTNSFFNEKNKKDAIDNLPFEEEFEIVDIDMGIKSIKPKIITNKYSEIKNNFYINRVGSEGNNNYVYFFEDRLVNYFANIYKVDSFSEQTIRISRGVDYPSKTLESSN